MQIPAGLNAPGGLLRARAAGSRSDPPPGPVRSLEAGRHGSEVGKEKEWDTFNAS